MKNNLQSWKKGFKRKIILSLLAFSTLTFSAMMFPTSLLAQEQEAYREAVLSEAELAQLLAPIALYPDALLTHILISSTYPIEVIEAARWLAKNPTLTTQQIKRKLKNKTWDASVKILVSFPRVINKLSDELVWTQTLGDAFLNDEASVIDTIQILRRQAEQAGSLDNMNHVRVIKEQRTIIIEPKETSVIYVPYYDPRVVYGRWNWTYHPPVFWHNPYLSTRHHQRFSWGNSIHIGSHLLFRAFHWKHRNVTINYSGDFSRKKIVNHHKRKRWFHEPRSRRGVVYNTGQKYTKSYTNVTYKKFVNDNQVNYKVKKNKKTNVVNRYNDSKYYRGNGYVINNKLFKKKLKKVIRQSNSKKQIRRKDY